MPASALRLALHGVLMNIMGVGVLLTGPPGAGKSELALELISRGHGLIADDAPLFTQLPDGSLQGSCPAVLRNYLHVRALGLLDIAMLFGSDAVHSQSALDLIVKLQQISPENPASLNESSLCTQQVLSKEITVTCLDAASPRLAILVECRARQHLSRSQGHCAERDFNTRHTLAMHSATT